MGRQIDFNVTGKARGELAKAIGEILNKEVRYMKVPTCNYEIGGSILDRNGVFIPSDELSDSQLDLLLERFVEKYMPSTDNLDSRINMTRLGPRLQEAHIFQSACLAFLRF